MGEPFLKMHGLGNDFVLVDRRASGALPSPEQALGWCDRHRGIGADGVLTLLPSRIAAARMVVQNADGSRPEMCGNGLRCVAKLLGDADPTLSEVTIETDAGLRRCALDRLNGQVVSAVAEMGAPSLDPASLPMIAPGLGSRFVVQTVPVGAEHLRATAVSMGNPHLVLADAPLDRAAELGALLETHPWFPQRTNVELIDRSDPQAGIRVAVWERGCGLTQACGTGACAVAVAGVVEGWLSPDTEARILLPGGALGVRVASDLSQVWMRGEVQRAFTGELPSA